MSDTRVCSKCGLEKNITDFHKRNTRILYCECKSCALSRSIKRRKALKEEAIKLLGGKCLDCGCVYPPYVYDFHHVDSSTKKYDPGIALQKSKRVFLEEISKCVLLCSNCHRIRHNLGY